MGTSWKLPEGAEKKFEAEPFRGGGLGWDEGFLS